MKQILPFKNIVDIYCACPCLVFISCCFKANPSLFSMKPKLPLLNLIQRYYLSKKVLSLFYSFKLNGVYKIMKQEISASKLVCQYYSFESIILAFYSFKPSFSNLNMQRNYSIKNSSIMLTQTSASIVLMLLKREDNFVNYLKIHLSNTSEKNLRYPFKEFKNKKRQ